MLQPQQIAAATGPRRRERDSDISKAPSRLGQRGEPGQRSSRPGDFLHAPVLDGCSRHALRPDGSNEAQGHRRVQGGARDGAHFGLVEASSAAVLYWPLCKANEEESATVRQSFPHRPVSQGLLSASVTGRPLPKQRAYHLGPWEKEAALFYWSLYSRCYMPLRTQQQEAANEVAPPACSCSSGTGNMRQWHCQQQQQQTHSTRES